MSSLYSANDTGNTSPTLSFFPSRPSLGAGPALSSAQGVPNRPVALMQKDTPANLSDADKLGGVKPSSLNSFYSPNDTQSRGAGGGGGERGGTGEEKRIRRTDNYASLTNAFSVPSRPRQLSGSIKIPSTLLGNSSHDDDRDSVCSEPVKGRGLVTPPVTPTPSLPGSFSLQMPAHLRSLHAQGKKVKGTNDGGKMEVGRGRVETKRGGEEDVTLSGRSTPLVNETQEITSPRQQERTWSTLHPSLSSSLPVTRLRGGRDEDVFTLKEQLRRLMEEKANLEGQLESVIDECQSTLKERSKLQSKLAQAEVELSTLHSDLTSSINAGANASKPSSLELGEEEGGMDLQTEVKRLESTLSQKRTELASKSREIEKERRRVKELSEELDAARNQALEKQKQVAETRELIDKHSSVLEEKDDAIEELKRQIMSLKGNLSGTESSKSWFRDQLQSAIDAKSKLQEELRGVRASGLSQSIKMEGLQKECDLLRQQVSELQDSILRDKAKLVTELEAIEADVLDKEGTYAQAQADKEQFQEQLQLKSSQLDKLISDLAEQKAANALLESQLDDADVARTSLESRLKTLEDEKRQVSEQAEHFQRTLRAKEDEGKELRKAKSNLQQRLQVAEMSIVSKDGDLQGLRDSVGLLKHELENLNESKKVLEEELSRYEETNGRLESEYEDAKNQLAQVESELQGEKKRCHLLESECSNLEAQLVSKEEELEEKGKALSNLQTQSDDIKRHFSTLQSQLQDIETQSGASLDEKERLIAQLKQEKKTALDQSSLFLEQEKELKEEIGHLKEENANLQGQLDSAVSSGPQLEDFKKVLNEKNSLDGQLASERLCHQQEGIKMQAKVARLETELKDARKENKKKEREFGKRQENMEQVIEDLQKQLEEAKEKLASHPAATDQVDGLNEAVEERNAVIETLEKEKLDLQEDNATLRERLRESDLRLSEVEQETEDTVQQLREELESKREQYEDEKHQLVVEVQHLKGRLSGINRSQQVMREHAAGLEKSLALKESQLQQLSTETNRLIAEKTNEVESLKSVTAELQDKESSLKTELQQALNSTLLETQRADGFERDLERLSEELERLKGATASSDDKEVKSLRESVSHLEQVKTDLQGEVRSLKQQLSVFQGNADSAQRELQESEHLITLLGQDLKLTKEELEQSQTEVATLQRLFNEKSSPQKPPQVTSSTLHFLDGGLSPVVKRGLEELQRAREGEEEERQRGEISALKSQLGTKSKTLKNLQSCLRELKNDMGYMQTKMDQHSLSLQHSYKSSQQLEDRIKVLQLSRSNSGPSTRSITPSS